MASILGWTAEQAAEMQLAANNIFETDERLRACQFSLSISDPNLKDCPFVGCSTGFTKMTGYEMDEVLGRNCRFLVDPVPAEYVNEAARTNARDSYPVYISERRGYPEWVGSDVVDFGFGTCCSPLFASYP